MVLGGVLKSEKKNVCHPPGKCRWLFKPFWILSASPSQGLSPHREMADYFAALPRALLEIQLVKTPLVESII